MNYDLGYFDEEAARVEPGQNPFGSKVLNKLRISSMLGSNITTKIDLTKHSII